MSNGRIMIVDDSIFTRNKLKQLFERHGFSVVAEASNGLEAIEQYRAFWPDLIIMDIIMPVMNGLEATKMILKDDPKAIIIMVSAVGQLAIVKEAFSLGAKDFIVKPYQENRIILSIKQHLNN